MEWIDGPIESRHVTGAGIVVESGGPPVEVGSKNTGSLFVERKREGDVITAPTARKTITDRDGDRLFLPAGWKDTSRSDRTIPGRDRQIRRVAGFMRLQRGVLQRGPAGD